MQERHMPKNKDAAPSAVAVRVLVDCAIGRVNDVAEISPDLLASYSASSMVDADPEAVAYAMTLPQNTQEH
jgi:hypothetical protein